MSRGPASQLPGLDRAWSRRLTAPDGDGIDRSWHVLDNRAGLVLNVLLNVLLIPRYGIVGAAAAWAVSLAVVNGLRVLQVWLTMRMLPFEAAAAKGLAAAQNALDQARHGYVLARLLLQQAAGSLGVHELAAVNSLLVSEAR